MAFSDNYISLKKNYFRNGDFELIPIRYEDRELIRQWRNEQIYHLRQNKELSPADQEHYFQDIVRHLFTEVRPAQLLFSFLHHGQLVGYGGLVHINWIDRNAEISFIMNTSLEHAHFEFYWRNYLALVENVAYGELDLHKIYTYAFDIRPRLYAAIESAGFKQEAVLKEHCYFQGKYLNVIIHSKFNLSHYLQVRKANAADLMLYFGWANDPVVRENSINKNNISLEDHTTWFNNKVNNPSSLMYVFTINNDAVGHVRLDNDMESWVISYVIDKNFRGLKLGTPMIRMIRDLNNEKKLIAFVKENNIASIKVFENCGFISSDNKIIDQQVYRSFISK